MPVRPSKIWKDLSAPTRLLAANAFWRDGDSPEIRAQHIEAIVTLAGRLKFRPKSIQALSVEQRAKHLAHLPEVSDGIATRALIAYHFAEQRPLMAAFLDALGMEHEDGVIKADDVPAPSAEKVSEAVKTLRGRFPDEGVELYLRTLSALDGDTWASVEGVLPLSH